MKRVAMKRLMFGVLGALAFAAATQAAEPAQDPTAEEANVQTAQSTNDKARVDERGCLRETGSRIQPRAQDKTRGCIAANGRVYSREDLKRTGEIDIAAALRKLDPSVY